MESFGVRFARALAERGPLCVGIDPHASLLHAWGLPDTPAGLAAFCDTVVEALADRVAVLKPQSAFFERFGSAGFAVLESTIRQCRERGRACPAVTRKGGISTAPLRRTPRRILSQDSPLYCGRDHGQPVPRFRVNASRFWTWPSATAAGCSCWP